MSLHRTRPDAGWTDGRKRAVCRYCGGQIPRGRRSFCSGAKTRRGPIVALGGVPAQGSGCVHEWLLRSDAGYLRQAVWDRDRGVCAGCGVQCRMRAHGVGGPAWQADHIVAVVDGGGECGLDGIQTLCVPCHAVKTAELNRRRRRAARGGAGEGVAGRGA